MSYSAIVQLTEAGEKKYKEEEFSEAEKHFQSALKESESYNDPNEYIARNKKVLGVFYLAQGNFDKAEPYFKDSLSICKNLFGIDNLRTAKSLTHCGLFYHRFNRMDQAETLYRQALEIENRTPYMKKPEANSMLRYLTLHLLAMLYCSQNRRDEALELCQNSPTIVREFETPAGVDLHQVLQDAIMNRCRSIECDCWMLLTLSNQLQKRYLGSVIEKAESTRGHVESRCMERVEKILIDSV